MPDKNKICFVVCPIGPEDSQTRDRSDKVLKYIIKPACKKCGYKTIRADQISRPGIITVDIVKHLYEDDLVIADLTEHNANVFYELAIRHTIRKSAIQMIHREERVPFDLSQVRTIMYDHTDLDAAEKCKDEIIEQIKAVEKDPTPTLNPVSTTAAVLSLAHSQEPLDQRIAELIEITQAQSRQLGEIRNMVLYSTRPVENINRTRFILGRIHDELTRNREILGEELFKSLEHQLSIILRLTRPSTGWNQQSTLTDFFGRDNISSKDYTYRTGFPIDFKTGKPLKQDDEK